MKAQSGVVLGIDIGTSGCKAVAVDEKGGIKASAMAEYPIFQPQKGYSEQEPEDWWQGAVSAISQVTGSLQAPILAVSLSGQMHGLVALDGKNQVIRPAILWNDQRTQEQCETITQRAGGLEGLLAYTNNMMLTGYTGSKLMWLKEREPGSYARTALVVNPKDYVRYRLTGELLSEASDASGTGLFDVAHRRWSTALIEKLGLNTGHFTACVESTALGGFITKKAAQLTGLAQGTPVYAGGGDAVISTVAMGLATPGTVGVTLGTSGVVATNLPGYAANPGGKLQLFCANFPNKWMAFGCTLAAAGSYQWFKNAFCGGLSFDEINFLAQKTPPGAGGLVFLPYLTGERCPVFDPCATGVFAGITSAMEAGHFARAVMEGVGFSLKQVFDLISANSNLNATQIVVSGGGAKSLLWRRILADIFALPVATSSGAAQGGALGAAMLAGIGCGLWDERSAAALITPVSTVEPELANKALYQERAAKYGLLHGALEQFNR